MRGFPILLALLLASHVAWGEAYSTWEDSAPQRLPVTFTNFQPPATTSSVLVHETYSLFNPPLANLFGYLHLDSVPASDFPLQARLLYVGIDSSSRVATANGVLGQLPSWTSPIAYVSPAAWPGKLLAKRSFKIESAAKMQPLPVWGFNSAQGYRFNELFGAYSVLLELAKSDGTILSRRCLIEAVTGQALPGLALARSGSDAGPYLKPLPVNLSTVDELPLEPEIYAHVRVLWLDDSTLADARYSDEFWRKIFLYRVMVLGHDREIQALAQRLGLSPNQRILLGGLWSVDHPTIDFKDQISPEGGGYDFPLNPGANPFRKDYLFGEKRHGQLHQFSFWFLLGFVLFEMVLIIASIRLLHGRRRFLLWFVVPLGSLVYTLAGALIDRCFIDFRPEVEMLQEVDSVEGWPQSLVFSGVSRLAFANGILSLHAPPSAEEDNFIPSPFSLPVVEESSREEKTLSVSQRYGWTSQLHFHYWIPNGEPCHITSDRHVVASRSFKAAWIWDGQVWRNLGPLSPGIPVSIDQASVFLKPEDAVLGSPGNFRHLNRVGDLPEVMTQILRFRYMTGLRNTNAGILLALDSQPSSDEVENAGDSEIHRQTLLVYQFKLPPQASP